MVIGTAQIETETTADVIKNEHDTVRRTKLTHLIPETIRRQMILVHCLMIVGC